MESCTQEVKIITVMWSKPPISILKLNTDGSALSNLGKIGGGGIFRDHQGNMIYAFTVPLGEGTNNQAEIQAPSGGLHWCIHHGYRKIVLEVDSELLTRWLNSDAAPPWKIQNHIRARNDHINQLEYFECNHIYREGNSTANILSKWSHKEDIPQHFYTVQQLHAAAKGSFILERLGMTSFRRKKLKRVRKPP